MAVFPVNAGSADFSSTGTSKFIPQLWAGRLIDNFYKKTYYNEISNSDYEGK